MTQQTHITHKPCSPWIVLVQRRYPFWHALSPLTLFLRRLLLHGGWRGGSGYYKPEDPLKLTVAVHRTIRSLLHCWPRQNDVLWATLMRSGYYWTAYMYTLAVHETYEGSRITLEEAVRLRHRYYRHPLIRWDFREDLLEPFAYHLPVPRLLHTHAVKPWASQRRLPVLLQIRHPYDAILSLYHFQGAHHEMSLAEYLASGRPHYVADFFNFWAPYVRSGHRVWVVKYEDLCQQPVETLKNIFSFLGIDAVRDDTLRYAVDACSVEHIRALHKKLERASSTNDLKHGRAGRPRQFEELEKVERAALRRFVESRFRHLFDYDVD